MTKYLLIAIVVLCVGLGIQTHRAERLSDKYTTAKANIKDLNTKLSDAQEYTTSVVQVAEHNKKVAVDLADAVNKAKQETRNAEAKLRNTPCPLLDITLDRMRDHQLRADQKNNAR